MTHKFEADGIILRYGLRTILSGIYIQSETGKITGLAGNNGSGKSSLMKIMFGTLEPESKSLRVNGKHTPYPYRLPGIISYLPQHSFLPKGKTVRSIFRDYDLNIDHFRNRFEVDISPSQTAGALHGSTARLVEIYTVLKSPGLFAMLDEPLTHLSPLLVERLLDYLAEEKQHKGIIVSDHNFNYLKSIADDLYFLNNGRLRHIKDTNALETYADLFKL